MYSKQKNKVESIKHLVKDAIILINNEEKEQKEQKVIDKPKEIIHSHIYLD